MMVIVYYISPCGIPQVKCRKIVPEGKLMGLINIMQCLVPFGARCNRACRHCRGVLSWLVVFRVRHPQRGKHRSSCTCGDVWGSVQLAAHIGVFLRAEEQEKLLSHVFRSMSLNVLLFLQQELKPTVHVSAQIGCEIFDTEGWILIFLVSNIEQAFLGPRHTLQEEQKIPQKISSSFSHGRTALARAS